MCSRFTVYQSFDNLVFISRERQMACKPGSVIDSYSSGTGIAPSFVQPTRMTMRETSGLSLSFLFGFAPGGVYHAGTLTSPAVRSYRTLSPLPLNSGGLLSVALALRSLSPGVTRHHFLVEPGLSSHHRYATARPSADSL